MLRSDNLIVDGLDDACKPVGGVYTYNQGVILGGLAELNLLAPNATLVTSGEAIATAVGDKLVDANGIMVETSCGDGALFKGIYNRYLRYFIDLTNTAQAPKFESFLEAQAKGVWNNARDKTDGYFGKSWTTAFDNNIDHNLQIAAVETLAAAINVEAARAIKASDKVHTAVLAASECSSHGMVIDGACVCAARFSGVACADEVSWGEHINGQSMTLTSGTGTLLCEVGSTSHHVTSVKIIELNRSM